VAGSERSEDGSVTGYHIGEHQEFRVTPASDLPSADEVAARVVAAHRLARLADTGPVVLRGTIDLPKLDRHSQTTTTLAWPDRWRIDAGSGAEQSCVAFDGTVVRQALGGRASETLEGPAAELLLQDSTFRIFGDWRALGIPIHVVQRLRREAEEVLIVRLGAQEAPATTLYVDWPSGRVKHLSGFTFIAGLGRVGERVAFSDYREIGGALLPWHTRTELAYALIGTMESAVSEVVLGVETPAGLFELRE